MNKKLILTTLLIPSLGEVFIPNVQSSSAVTSPKELLSPISGKKIERTPNSPVVIVPNTDTTRVKIIAKMIKDEEDAKMALISKISALEKSLKELIEKNNKAEESIKTLNISIEEKTKNIESIKKEIEQKEKNLEEKSRELTTSTGHSKELEESIQKLESDQKLLTETLRKAEEEKNQLTSDLKKEQETSEKLKTDLEEKSQELKKLQGKHTELQGTVAYARLKQKLEETLKTYLDVYKQQEQLILNALKNLTQDDFSKVDRDNSERLFKILNFGVLSQVEKSFSEFFAERLKSIATKIEHRRERILEEQQKGTLEASIFDELKNEAEKSLLKDCLVFKPEDQLWTALSESFNLFGITLNQFDFNQLIPNYNDLTKHRIALSVVSSKQPSAADTLIAGLKKSNLKKK